MKRLVYIFIPVLAVLLMSHNTYAVDNIMTPQTCYDILGQGVQCVNYELTTGNTIQVIGISKQSNAGYTINATEHFLWALRVRNYGGTTGSIAINLSNGYPEMATIDYINQDCNTSNNVTTCNILVSGVIMLSNWNIQLAGMVSAYGQSYSIDSLYFASFYDYEVSTFTRLTQIYTYLQNHPSASAQDIANAIENTAEQNTQNAANDSQTTGSSSSQDATTATSSLISAIGGFVGAVTTASPTNCVVNFTTNQLTIGNMDLCANPVPAYVQIIGSIILICAAIPLAIVLFNRFIGLFRSFQG